LTERGLEKKGRKMNKKKGNRGIPLGKQGEDHGKKNECQLQKTHGKLLPQKKGTPWAKTGT